MRVHWPPQCCVPAFVHAALVQLGVECAFPETIPSILGIRVRPDQPNPLGLALCDGAHPAGIRGADAEREVNRMCRELELDIRLRRIPFNTVFDDLWAHILQTALERSLVVGIGVDYGILSGRAMADGKAQHVLRVLSRSDDLVALFDDSGEVVPPTIEVDLERVRKAAFAVADGLWIFGNTKNLNFTHALPWQAEP